MNDLTGKRFGKLVAIEAVGRDKHRYVVWRCKCDCGKECIVSAGNIKKTKSCGCWNTEAIIMRNTSHGGSQSKLYKVWASIKQRCSNSKNKRYKDYGGRGITLCDEWKDFEPFKEWALENGYREGLQLDRVDNNKGYSPNNCRFVEAKENCRNKRDNVFITVENKTGTISEWAEMSGIPAKAISKRLKAGWGAKDAVSIPLGGKKKVMKDGV